MKNSILWLLAATSVVLSACGTDNVSACNRWKESVKCGVNSSTLDMAINCEAYKNTTCDLSEYFDCLSTAYVCVNGTYDSVKLANATACTSKSVCQ